MVPKIIHICWFSDDPYPVEIKICMDSWRRVLPDYKIKVWRMADARAIGIPYIDEALDARRWAFAADAVRYYALWTEGGVYMDSDIFLYRRFDDFLPKEGGCVTFHECIYPGHTDFGLQAAFVIADKGNEYCRRLFEYYRDRHYIKEDGTQDNYISPLVMKDIAAPLGYVSEDRRQDLPGLTVYPTHFLAPRKRYVVDGQTIGQHRVYGSWRKRKLNRRIEIKLKHYYLTVRYALLKR